MKRALAALVLVLAACANSGDGDEDGRGGAGTGGTTADSCANVGCAPPPLCATGCTQACGCCTCAEGEIIERTGTSYRCEGGCYAEFTLEPTPWNRLQVDEGWGPCPDSEICALSWVARPDGSVEVTREGMTTSAVMPAADLEALELIIADQGFRDAMSGQDDFGCLVPPSDVAYYLTLELPDAEYMMDVTSCVLTGPPGNQAERAVDLLSKY